MAYLAKFKHLDGSVDALELTSADCDAAALRLARSALFVSLSAVSVDVQHGDQRVGHIRREAPRFGVPADPRRFARGMVPA